MNLKRLDHKEIGMQMLGEMNLTYKWHIRCQTDAMMHAAATALLKGMS